MGLYFYQNVAVKLNQVQRLSEVFDLPAPKFTEDSEHGYEYAFLTAAEVRKYVEAYTSIIMLHKEVPEAYSQNVADIALLYHVGEMMNNHASDYIYSAMVEADKLGLSGGERKNHFRKATKSYTLNFG